jgi:pilus assembly protein CpaB
MRAYAILTPNDSSLVAGLVEPGDKVDVLLTDDSDKELTGGGVTTVLMPNIEVMAIGQIIDGTESREKNSRKMRSVTLAVTPEQANQLQMAQKTGTLGLALRSDKDDATSKVSAVTLKELLRTAELTPVPPPQPQEVAKVVAVPEQPPVEPKQPSQIAVQTLRGSLRSTMVMRVSEASGAYLESNPFEAAPSLPPNGQGATQ